MTDLTHDARLARATKQAGDMRRVTEMLIPLLIAAIGLPLIGGVYLEVFERDGGVTGAVLRVIDSVPAMLAAMAVISLHGVLVEYTAGRLLSQRASDAFRHAGQWALGAFGVKIVVLPIAAAILTSTPYAWRFDPLDIALMVFAALVVMIGEVLQTAAAALKAENDQII
jgi:hypothetical protein